MTRRAGWLRNVLATYGGAGLDAVVLVLLTPFVVHHLGVTAYGLWVLGHSVTYYLGLLDLGLHQTLVKTVAERSDPGAPESLRPVIDTTFASFAVAGLVALVLTLLLAYLTPDLFHVSAVDVRTFRIVLLLLGIDCMISFPASVFDALLEGCERFDVMNAVSAAFTLLRAAATVVLLALGHGIVALAVLEVASALLGAMVDWRAVRVVLPDVRVGLAHAGRGAWSEMRDFTLWLSANEVLQAGGEHLDRILVAGFLSVAVVTPFSLAATLAAASLWIIAPASEVLFPIAARYRGRGDESGLRTLLLRGTKGFVSAALPVALVVAFFGDRILDLWVGEPFTRLPDAVVPVLAGSLFVTVFFSAASTILVALEKLKPLFVLSLAEGVLTVAFALLLVGPLGLVGIAIAFAAASAVITLGAATPYVCRVLAVAPATLLGEGLLRPLVAAAPAAAVAWWLAGAHPPTTWPGLVLVCAVVGVAYLIPLLAIGLTRVERAVIAREARRRLA